MSRKRSVASLFLLCALLIAAVAGEQAWKKYTNARFGFLLMYPPSLSAGREPENGGGLEFHTRDKEFGLATSAHFFADEIGDTFEKKWSEELAMPGVKITYKKKADNWYVVSGVTSKGIEFYHKLYRQGDNWARFDITYPHTKNKQYDPWVTRIAKEFVPFLPGDFDRI